MLKLKHIGGSRVKKGTYWNYATGERVSFEGEGILPGGAETGFYRASPAVILFAGPIAGLVYAVFLPFIGIAMLLQILAVKVLGGVMGGAREGASFGWRPLESYITGKKGKKSEKETKNEDDTTC